MRHLGTLPRAGTVIMVAMTTATTTRREQLGDFLRRRREMLTPEQVGLPPAGRRRTPGLRRDEVAGLAAMSTVYYERLEQGRGAQPSAPMLLAIAGALRLDDEERDHLLRLAGHAAPTPAQPEPVADPGLLFVLDTAGVPGFISDDLGTVLAQNDLNIALFGRFAGARGREGNLIWRWFTSPQWRFTLESPVHHEETGRGYVADLRLVAGQRDYDPAVRELIAALRAASSEFALMWDEHRVATLQCPPKRVDDERVGLLEFDCVLLLSPLSRQRMLLLKPMPETPTAERLAALGALIGRSPY
jgi:transcriptional regulator with XRE-family HTH domain